MKLIKLILILIILNIAVFGEDLLYDGTADYKTAVIKPDVKAIFESDVFPKVSQHFKPKTACEEIINILDGAAISVYENLSEKVYLYDYSCGDPVNFPQGFAVIQNSKVTQNYAFNNPNVRYDHIFYRNGLILMAGRKRGLTKTLNIITAIDSSNPLTGTGEANETSFVTYEACDDGCPTTAKKIYYEYGDGYFFWTEGYQLKNGQWVKTSAKKIDYEGGLHQLSNFAALE